MGTKPLRALAVGMAVGAAVMIGACTRSATTGATPTSAAASTSGPLTGQQATMEAVRSALLTQTAQAAPGGGGGGTATATPLPGVATATVGAGTVVVPANTPISPPGTPIAVPTFPVPSSYTLHEGEFPYCLGRRFNRNPDDILAINGLSSGSYTYPGQTLQIPTTGTFLGQRALLSHPTTYVVRGGDTIYSVACQFGDVYPEGIAVANGLSDPFLLTPGSTIQIP
jgi:LysM repeat protein